MAKEQKESISTDTTEKQETKQMVKAEQQESFYTIEEFASNANELFGTMPECVTVALKIAGKESYPLSEAKKIVEHFLNKEVE